MDFAPASVIDFKFSTTLDGVPTTLAGTPAISIYKDNSTTQTTTGVTLSVDFDGITGLHNVRIDTADAFYASGSSFQVIVTTGTVGGGSIVGHVVNEFTLDRANVGSLKANVITATSINADAITAAKIADGAIDAATFAASAITSTVLADNAITAAKIASDAITAAKIATGAIDADAVAADAANEIADALLNRDMSAVSDTTDRSPLNALRFLRNKWALSAGTLTVRKEDDTTSAWTAAVSTDAAAVPVIGSDPA
jgi:hypothetical protein